MNLQAHPAVPKGVSSMRALPEVHDALRRHDPSKAPASQPILSKKAPPTTAGFYSDSEPPRIGSEQVQPAPPPKLPGSTPTTPAHPPRPPISALPQPVQESSTPATLKHPLPQPAQQGPPNKQVRHKAFPVDQQANPTTSMAAPSAVDTARMSAPSPKGPPASFLPTPENVQQMDSCAAAAALSSARRRFYKIRSASDINWSRPLKEQEVLTRSRLLRNFACSAATSQSSMIMVSKRSIHPTTSYVSLKRPVAGIASMELIGSVSSSSR